MRRSVALPKGPAAHGHQSPEDSPRGVRAEVRCVTCCEKRRQNWHARGARMSKIQPEDHQPHPQLTRSEEHTSELQSRQYLVCRLLLEKKINTVTYTYFY